MDMIPDPNLTNHLPADVFSYHTFSLQDFIDNVKDVASNKSSALVRVVGNYQGSYVGDFGKAIAELHIEFDNATILPNSFKDLIEPNPVIR